MKKTLQTEDKLKDLIFKVIDTEVLFHEITVRFNTDKIAVLSRDVNINKGDKVTFENCTAFTVDNKIAIVQDSHIVVVFAYETIDSIKFR